MSGLTNYSNEDLEIELRRRSALGAATSLTEGMGIPDVYDVMESKDALNAARDHQLSVVEKRRKAIEEHYERLRSEMSQLEEHERKIGLWERNVRNWQQWHGRDCV